MIYSIKIQIYGKVNGTSIQHLKIARTIFYERVGFIDAKLYSHSKIVQLVCQNLSREKFYSFYKLFYIFIYFLMN